MRRKQHLSVGLRQVCYSTVASQTGCASKEVVTGLQKNRLGLEEVPSWS